MPNRDEFAYSYRDWLFAPEAVDNSFVAADIDTVANGLHQWATLRIGDGSTIANFMLYLEDENEYLQGIAALDHLQRAIFKLIFEMQKAYQANLDRQKSE